MDARRYAGQLKKWNTTRGLVPAPRARPPPSQAIPLSRSPARPSVAGRVIVVLILAAVGMYGYKRYDAWASPVRGWVMPPAPDSAYSEPVAAPPIQASPLLSAKPQAPAGFRCDGRTMCSQMTSCQEATLFLKNCPGMKMDGNGDGVPCEQQWCH